MKEPLIFYYRDGCHLCEQMVAEIHRHWPDVLDSMQWRNVDDKPEWQKLYGIRIPLLLLGDRVLSEHFAESEKLVEYFGEMRNKV